MTEDPRPGPRPPLEDDDENGGDLGGPSRGASVARFFVLPLLVVGTALIIFLVFNLMTFERRSPADELAEVRGGTANRRWQAAFELSRSISRIPAGPEREAFAAETRRVFSGLSTRRPEDVKVRRYLVLVLGKLQDRAALPDFVAAAKDPDPETRLYAIWAIGMLGDASALDTVLEASSSDDPGVRKMAAYVLGKLGDIRAVPRLRVLLGDPAEDVRWNAAIALASLHDPSGADVLRAMIDRGALVKRLSPEQLEIAMTSALQALALLRDPASLPALDRIAREDPNLRVREAARKAAEATRSPATGGAAEKPSANLERSGAVLVG
ncbi:MAG TPA: HEAT repeat domain-containing protein [Thermoanaerobaculia bacterium]|nr:HEAT repeat domain-containing protein [Thermoanaerobaculia bacterium]